MSEPPRDSSTHVGDDEREINEREDGRDELGAANEEGQRSMQVTDDEEDLTSSPGISHSASWPI